MRTLHSNDQTYLWYKLIFIIAKTDSIRGTKTKLLYREELSTINREVLESSQLHWYSLSDPIILNFLLFFSVIVGHDRGKLTTRGSILKGEMIILFLV